MVSLTPNQIKGLKRQTTANIQSVLAKLGVEGLYETQNKLISPCPVHDGDNFSAFNINIDQNSEYYGCWFCNSHKCHEDYGNDIIGLIKAIMSKKTTEEVSFNDVLTYLHGFISGQLEDIDFDSNIVDYRIDKIFNQSIENSRICTRQTAINGLEIPCPLYSSRGFSNETLVEFDVGYCNTRGKQMYQRTVFPVYDREGKYLVGAVGRSHNDAYAKWKNSQGFNTGNNLYSYHRAFESIKASRSVVLTEGQGDVMKMYEAGIENCVGLFSCKLSDRQAILLEEASVDTIYLALDNDEAGQRGMTDIIDKYKFIFDIKKLKFPGNDLGDLTVEYIQKEILPKVSK